MEIEAKYLLMEDGVVYASEPFYTLFPSVETLISEANHSGIEIWQGYLGEKAGREIIQELNINLEFKPVVFRMREYKGNHVMTIKGEGLASRDEYEQVISPEIFLKYWPMTQGRRIHKKRLVKPYRRHKAEIDVYLDRDLITAEIEVDQEAELSGLDRLGSDVTADPKYKNNNLAG